MAEFPGGGNWRLALGSPKPARLGVLRTLMTDTAYEIHGEDLPSRWLLTCDHASNAVPESVGGTLGLSEGEMGRHIAYDIGAASVTLHLSRLLGAPCILSRFSRLVIDPNRGEDDPTLVMKLYDGTIIPGNRHVGSAEVERRLGLFYRPYHTALARLAARRTDTAICAIHSFTPRLIGRHPRPWHVGILHAEDDALSHSLLARLRAEPDLCVGDNEPYTGALAGDSLDRHGVRPGRPHVLIELRHDLIATADGQRAWAERLAPHLDAALGESGL